MNIKVVYSMLAPNGSKRIGYVDRSSSPHSYKVWLYIEGPDLPFVDKVTYILHKTFRNPYREITRTPANPNCALEIWTWGLFTVKVIVVDKKGETTIINHRLSYDKYLRDKDVHLVSA